MSKEKISLQRQADAVELEIVNRRGFIAVLRPLVAKGKRAESDLVLAQMPLPALRAALATLRFIQANETVLRDAMTGKK
jgi:hypothetical protein